MDSPNGNTAVRNGGITILPGASASPAGYSTVGFIPAIASAQADIDAFVTEQVWSLMTTGGHTFSSSISGYYTGVHLWLEIVSESKVSQGLANILSLPRADFATLILCMFLVTQLSHGDSDPECLENLYRMAKTFHGLLQSHARISVETIQAGLLLAVYEHTQAMRSAAFLTIGTCGRMADFLGLYICLSPEVHIPAREMRCPNYQVEKNVWWGVYVLERKVCCRSNSTNHLFVID